MTILEAYSQFVLELNKLYDKGETRTMADWIFEDLAHLPPHIRREKGAHPIDPRVSERVNSALTDLMNHKPIQYILGEAWFYKMKFKVNEQTLIPRPETEELITWIVQDHQTTSNLLAVDIGTGTGCIAIALKKTKPSFTIIALDISPGAIKIAKENADLYQAAIDFRETDFLNEDSWNKLGHFDLVISNPPYIPFNEKIRLEKNVTEYEPHLALFVENDPMLFYNKIARFAVSHLHSNGNIYVEVHEDYALEVQSIFTHHKFTSILRKDSYQRDRMIKAFR